MVRWAHGNPYMPRPHAPPNPWRLRTCERCDALRLAADMSASDRSSVPTVSLDWLLATHGLRGRRDVAAAGRLCVKLDAEASEYFSVPPAVESGNLCAAVDVLEMEQHPRYLMWSGEHKADWHAHVQRLRRALSSLRTTPKCRTRVWTMTP